MLSLPIARRELLILSRAPSTWRNRLASSFVVFAFGVVFVTMYQSLGKTEFNQVIRNAGWSLSLVCLYTGLLLTSDAITSEKREGTLGLLFLSNLSPFEILIGKFIAHSLLGFYSVLLFMPLLAVSLVFGEVLLQDVLFYIGSSLNLLFFSAAVGLFASSMLSDPKAAVWVSCVIVSFFWWGMPQWAKFLTAVNAPGWLIDSVSFLSIHFLSPTSAAMAKVLPFQSALWKVLSTQILAWSFIGLAAWLLPYRWQENKVVRSNSFAELWKRLCYGSASARLRLRRKLLERNPFLWLASRNRLQVAIPMIVTVVFIGIIGWHLSRAKVEVGFVILMVVCLSMAQKGMLGQAVGAQLLQEYERGSLEMILSTSLTVKDVIGGQFAAASRQFRAPFVISLLLLWAGAGLVYVHFGQSAWLGATALACYSAIFALEFRALRWVGIWSLVSADDPRKARGSAGFRLSMLPVLVAAAFYFFIQVLNWLFDAHLTFTPGVAVGLFLALAFCNALFWMYRAKRSLPHELRRFAHRRYMPQEQLTLFGRMGRFAGRLFRLNPSLSEK